MDYQIRNIKPEELLDENEQPTETYIQMCNIYEKATGHSRSFSADSGGAKQIWKLAEEGLVIAAFDDNDKMLGFSTAMIRLKDNSYEMPSDTDDRGWIMGAELAVDPEYQKQGIGKSLIKRFIDNKSYESGCNRPFAFTFDLKNPQVARFYIQEMGVIGMNYAPKCYGSGRMINSWTDENMKRKCSLEEIAGETVFDASGDLEAISQEISKKLPGAFNLKFAENKGLRNFFDFVFNKQSYILTEVIKENNEFYYRFQTPEKLFDSGLSADTESEIACFNSFNRRRGFGRADAINDYHTRIEYKRALAAKGPNGSSREEIEKQVKILKILNKDNPKVLKKIDELIELRNSKPFEDTDEDVKRWLKLNDWSLGIHLF